MLHLITCHGRTMPRLAELLLMVAMMVCIVMIAICMPNEGVCPIQVIIKDADMAEKINFNR